MESFSKFNARLQSHVKTMTKDVDVLYTIDLDKDELWNKYLDSFPGDTNPMFRKRREFDCSCCRHFVKAFGNVVSIKGGVITTIWDFESHDPDYQVVIDALAKFVKAKRIENVFVTKEITFGTAKSYEKDDESGKVLTWDHFNASIDSRFQYNGGDTIGTVLGNYRAVREVFERSLKELSTDSVETVLDLIGQKSLYKGEEWKSNLEKFLTLQKKYKTSKNKDTFCWVESVAVGPVIGKIRNHSIGTLLIDLSEGMDLDKALRRYESVVAPSNYMRPKEVFTKKMIEEAEKVLTSEGLIESLGRRHATLDDITVNNILFADRGVSRKLTKGSIFDELKADQTVSPKSLGRVEEIGIEDFIDNVLPTATSLEVYLDNRHSSNFVSLIAPEVPDSKSLFKWNNGFSWAYKDNMTDSMRERVRAAGGSVDGVLRFTHSWNHVGRNASLMDLHVFMPGSSQHDDGKHDKYPSGQRVGWNHRKDLISGGVQDVDYTNAAPEGYIPIENITFPSLAKLKEGKYVFKIHNWALRAPTTSGFKAEIEFGGQIYQYEVSRPLANKEWITVAEATLKNGQFTIEHKLSHAETSKVAWGLKTQQFHPVQVCMFSPNYWDAQDGIGHRHYFFMLKGTVNDESPNGFFNEYIREEFMKHKRVFSALGSKMRVEPTDSQLSGVGFSATKHDTLTVKVGGRVNRTLTVKF
jgi:hypothetical protein